MVNQPGGGSEGKSSVPLIDDGGPAFPVETPMEIYPGMSLRKYFAGQALIGLLISNSSFYLGNKQPVAKFAYEIADAMIKESKNQST